jgi:arylsulfatase A
MVLQAGTRSTRQLLAAVVPAVLLAGALFLARETPSAPVAAPRAIILVVADDLGWGDLETYNPAARVRLPALESLAAQGLVVRGAHSASSVCAPSRYSVLTGNYPWRGRRRAGVWNPYEPSQILPGQSTLAERLAGAGYRTGFFGKWHLGAQWRDGQGQVTQDPQAIDWSRGFFDGPQDHGFAESTTALCGWQGPPYALFESGRPVGETRFVAMTPPGRLCLSRGEDCHALPRGYGDPAWDQETAADSTLARVVDFATRHAGEPFFLEWSAYQAHWSWTETGASGISSRLDQVIEFDRDLSRVLTVLADLGLADDTLLVVTSDNGAPAQLRELAHGHDANGGLRGQKGQLYEGGSRVPFIARWPGRIPPGSVLGDEHLVGLQDLFATLAHAAGTPLADGDALDSVDQLAAWLDPANAPPARASLAVQDNHARLAYYRDHWKLTTDPSGHVWQLFDLAADPGEITDVARSQPELAEVLRGELLRARRGVGTRPSLPRGPAAQRRHRAAAGR